MVVHRVLVHQLQLRITQNLQWITQHMRMEHLTVGRLLVWILRLTITVHPVRTHHQPQHLGQTPPSHPVLKSLKTCVRHLGQ